MVYTKPNWSNNAPPPLDASNLNEIGTALERTNITDSQRASLGIGANATIGDALMAVSLGASKGWQLLQEWTTAGTYTWTVPDLFGGKSYEIGVLVIGAGGSGAAYSGVYNGSGVYYGGYATGGGSGDSIYFLLSVVPGGSKTVVVGNKGASVVSDGSAAYNIQGNNGGTSSFDGKIANGGRGGYSSVRRSYAAVNTMVLSAVSADAEYGTLFGGDVTLGTSTSGSTGSGFSPLGVGTYSINPAMCFNPFECKRILGSGGSSLNVNSNHFDPIDGTGGGIGATSETSKCTAGSATAPGCGGGGACCNSNSSTKFIATSGAGADGAVKLYVRGVTA